MLLSYLLDLISQQISPFFHGLVTGPLTTLHMAVNSLPVLLLPLLEIPSQILSLPKPYSGFKSNAAYSITPFTMHVVKIVFVS